MDDELGVPVASSNGAGVDAFEADLDDVLAAPDELPQIAGVLDERPPELRETEYANSDRWARVGAADTNLTDVRFWRKEGKLKCQCSMFSS